jgi:membrane-associated protein
VLGRFVPFVRTYITVVAGITKMDRRKFLTWSTVGALLWVLSITLMGYFLGRSFPAIGRNIDYAMIAILAFTVIPLAYEGWRHRGPGDDHDESSADSTAPARSEG